MTLSSTIPCMMIIDSFDVDPDMSTESVVSIASGSGLSIVTLCGASAVFVGVGVDFF